MMPVIRLLTCLCALALCVAAAPPGEIVEKHPDGTLKARYRQDADGARVGAYQEMFPGGTKLHIQGQYTKGKKSGTWITRNEAGKVIESAGYRNDLLDGALVRNFPSGKPMLRASYRAGAINGPVVVLDEKGKTIRQIVYPRTLDTIQKAWASLYPAQGMPIEYVEAPSLTSPHKAGMMKDAPLQEALRLTKLYRFLSGVPKDNVRLDASLTTIAQHGAVVCQNLNHITHTPAKPPGMDDAFFKIGSEGCGKSNLTQGHHRLTDAVHGFMDDSDASNISRVGHRAWILTPGLEKIGFGAAEEFIAMHVASNRPATDYQFIAFPGHGYYPAKLIKPHYAWNVLINDKSNLTGNLQVKMTKLDDYFQDQEQVPTRLVALPAWAGGKLVIFKPDFKKIEPAKYWVEISGADQKGGRITIGYIVDFVDMPAKIEQAESKE